MGKKLVTSGEMHSINNIPLLPLCELRYIL